MRDPIQFTTCLKFPNTPAKENWQRANRVRRSDHLPTIEQVVVDSMLRSRQFEEIPVVAAVDMSGDSFLISITKMSKS